MVTSTLCYIWWPMCYLQAWNAWGYAFFLEGCPVSYHRSSWGPLHHNPSTGHCLTATLANRPLANYHHKDCQSNAGVSSIYAVTLRLMKVFKGFIKLYETLLQTFNDTFVVSTYSLLVSTVISEHIQTLICLFGSMVFSIKYWHLVHLVVLH